MLDLNRLKALHAVAVYGSVGAAAEALMVTPSAISQQLAKLERETGAPLLERNGRGVRLTDAAGVLAEHAERILALVEMAEADFQAMRGAVVGRLSIGAFPTAARGIMPEALALLKGRHPNLELYLYEREPDRQIRDVTRGELDLAVVQDWTNQPLAIPDGLDRAPILEDIADVALPASHPYAERDEVHLNELYQEKWISSDPGQICHDWLVFTLRSAELEPEIACFATEYDTQLALVAAGHGCAIVPRLGRMWVPEGVRMVPVRPRPVRRLFALWRTDAARRPAIRAAVEAIRAAGEALGAARPEDGSAGGSPAGGSPAAEQSGEAAAAR